MKKKDPEQQYPIMDSAFDVPPESIKTSDCLLIKNPCSVIDVFGLIVEHKNIKTVNVCGRVYTSQEIFCMEINQGLGVSPIHEQIIRNPEIIRITGIVTELDEDMGAITPADLYTGVGNNAATLDVEDTPW